MPNTNNGGPAFPREYSDCTSCGRVALGVSGMSLRDWFAGQALTCLMSSESWARGLDNECSAQGVPFKVGLAQHVYQMADAMLAERAK